MHLHADLSEERLRVEVELKHSEKNENKWLFDQLKQQRAELEEGFGEGLRWLRMDDKKASKIVLAHDFDGFDQSNWLDMTVWLCEHVVRLEQPFSEPLARLNRQLKSGIEGSVADGTAELAAEHTGQPRVEYCTRGATGEEAGRRGRHVQKVRRPGEHLRTADDAGRYVRACARRGSERPNLMRIVPNHHPWRGATSELARGAAMLRNKVRMS